MEGKISFNESLVRHKTFNTDKEHINEVIIKLGRKISKSISKIKLL